MESPGGQVERPLDPLTWSDLIDVDASHRVLLVDPGDRRAEASLGSRAHEVTTIRPGEVGRARLSGLYNLICLDAVGLPPPTQLRRLRRLLSPTGQVAVVLDNELSPLRALDRLPDRTRRGAPPGLLGRSTRRLEDAGLPVRQVFGLLRSSASPATAFDLRSRSAVGAVAASASSHIVGVRGELTRLMPRLPPTTLARLVPAWLLVGGAAPEPLALPPIVGKIANRDSEEIKLVRGDPPSVLERCYLSLTPETAAEVAALLETESVGFALAPRIVGTPQPRRVAVTWLPGTPLVTGRLDDDDLVDWVRRAARVLGRLQELTRHDDGTVLVHGDLWLGNLLVDGDEITGVVDWTSARRGSPEIDRAFLVSSLDHRLELDRELRSRVAAARDEGLGDPLRRPGLRSTRW